MEPPQPELALASTLALSGLRREGFTVGNMLTKWNLPLGMKGLIIMIWIFIFQFFKNHLSTLKPSVKVYCD